MRVYYDDGCIRIRSMEYADAQIFYDKYLSYNWHPEMATYENYYRDQESGKRLVFIAEYQGVVSGICTLVLNPDQGPFGNQGIPEIEDLGVFFHVHKKGIGSRLLDVAEIEAAKVADQVYLAVGVHSGYGPAQRIYVKRGYLPDGSGVWYKGTEMNVFMCSMLK